MRELTILFVFLSTLFVLSGADKPTCNDTYIHYMGSDENYLEIETRLSDFNASVFSNGLVISECACGLRNCFRKCCQVGAYFDVSSRLCKMKPKNDSLLENGVGIYNYDYLTRTASLRSYSAFVYGKPCVGVFRENKDWYIQKSGQLYVKVQNGTSSWTIHGPDSYCVDTFVTEGPDGQTVSKLDALICFAATQDSHHYVLSSTCMITSCVFLLATLAVYAWLPELRNLHGKVLMVYLACLLVGFAFFSAMQVMLVFDSIPASTCFIFTIVIYFSLESAFFWLNVMSFDIWWTFSGKRGPSSKLSTRARFVAYAAYAFGIPTALTVILVSLEFAGLPRYPWLPGLREGGCFIHGTSKLIYFYGPIVILCIANMTFFILTALKITQIQKQTSVLKSKESSMHDRHRNDKQRLWLYLKLFTVMGVNWILEVISAVYPDWQDFWKYTDAYNVLIGLVIFIIFVCKRKIFRLIKKRIKDRFQQPQTDAGEMTDIRNRNINQWKNHQQRASQETIRTTVLDNDSIMNGVVSH